MPLLRPVQDVGKWFTVVVRACLVLCAVAMVASCTHARGADESAHVSSGAVDLSGLSVEDSRTLRGDAARAAQLDLQRCLEERGFPAQMAADGTLSVDVGDQHEAYQRVSQECDQAVDYGAAAAPLSELEIRWLYDENVKAFHCLSDRGFTPAEPVSFGVFLADYQEGRPPWTPFLTANSDAPIITESCPEPSLSALQ